MKRSRARAKETISLEQHARPPGLPSFLIIGAQKCGTTSLYHYLSSHPQVFMPETKELDFFVQEKMWGRGIDWYRSHFAAAGPAVAVGEASPSYTCFPHFGDVPARIASVLPDVRMIYLVREPIARMRSAYRHGYSAGIETRPISDALLFDTRYADLGRYALQLEQFEQHFDRSQFLVLTAEDLHDHRETTLARALTFIGVNPSWLPADLRESHNTASERAMRPRALWRELGDFVIKHPKAGRMLKGLHRLNGRALVSRPIRDEEMRIEEDLRERLTLAMRPDVERLAQWMDPTFDGWGLLGAKQSKRR